VIGVHDRFIDLAAASIDFELSPAERAELDGHLTTCAPCRSFAAALRADARALGDLPRITVPPHLAGQMRSRLRSGSVDWAP
jgi:anti-sigma factor RsiW